MTYLLIIDLVILAVLLFFSIRGAHRGLIISLFSLLSALVAFVGALLISNYCAAPVAKWMEPSVSPSIQSAVESALPDQFANAELSAENIILMLEDADLPFGLDETLANYFAEHPPALDTGAMADNLITFLTQKITHAIAYVALFLISFIVILLLWKLLSRTLDLVARLPGLKLINRLGGFLFGLLHASILLFVLAWLVRLLGSNPVPVQDLEQTYLFRFFMTFNPLDYLANL